MVVFSVTLMGEGRPATESSNVTSLVPLSTYTVGPPPWFQFAVVVSHTPLPTFHLSGGLMAVVITKSMDLLPVLLTMLAELAPDAFARETIPTGGVPESGPVYLIS